MGSLAFSTWFRYDMQTCDGWVARDPHDVVLQNQLKMSALRRARFRVVAVQGNLPRRPTGFGDEIPQIKKFPASGKLNLKIRDTK